MCAGLFAVQGVDNWNGFAAIRRRTSGIQSTGWKRSFISSAKRLKLLKKHQITWDRLSWSREIKIPMREGGLWELYGGVLAQSTGRYNYLQSTSFGFVVHRRKGMDPG
ncbi:hypothetical protein CPB84DRAFT_1760123 [Gymnopilus junonius]|uniref:Uncharacterized protein n=1 Tax=Gymnopilus junonius TaxID=109634 RepID=A0A9P5NXU2_GYMJU|nr:hypothetical protein CPB84DRAFT_1760123 [Gymnopilus junonius]